MAYTDFLKGKQKVILKESAAGAGLHDGKPTGKLKDVRLYHERFGHAGKSYMKRANKIYDWGLKNKDIDEFFAGACCTGCVAGKIQKQRFTTSTPKKYDEVWAVDILGPFHPDLDDNTYTALFVEYTKGDIVKVHLQKRKQFTNKALPEWHKHRMKNLKQSNTVSLTGIIRDKYTTLRGDNAKSLTARKQNFMRTRMFTLKRAQLVTMTMLEGRK